MDKLDKFIKNAKPSVPELPEAFSSRVMSEIRRAEANSSNSVVVSSQSRPWVLFGSIALLIVGLILVNQSIFEIQSNGTLELLNHGGHFITAAFRYIPFDIIIVALTTTLLASWMIWRSNTFKTGLATVLAGSILISGFGGAVMAATDINIALKDRVTNDWRKLPWFSHFYKDRARYCIDHPNFRMGHVKDIKGSNVVIVDPNGKSSLLSIPTSMNVERGQVISVTGERSDKRFIVEHGRHCSMKRAGKYFNGMPMDMPMMKHHMKGGMMRRQM